MTTLRYQFFFAIIFYLIGTDTLHASDSVHVSFSFGYGRHSLYAIRFSPETFESNRGNHVYLDVGFGTSESISWRFIVTQTEIAGRHPYIIVTERKYEATPLAGSIPLEDDTVERTYSIQYDRRVYADRWIQLHASIGPLMTAFRDHGKEGEYGFNTYGFAYELGVQTNRWSRPLYVFTNIGSAHTFLVYSGSFKYYGDLLLSFGVGMQM